MKKTLLLTFGILYSLFTYAQEPAKRTELGLGTYGFGFPGNLVLRTGNDHALWRLRSLDFNISFPIGAADSINQRSSISTGLAIGREWRKPIRDKWSFRGGFDLLGTYARDKTIIPTVNSGYQSLNYSIGVSGVLGASYQINDYIILGGEILPSISGKFSLEKQLQMETWQTTQNEFSFNSRISNSILFSVAYVFQQKIAK